MQHLGAKCVFLHNNDSRRHSMSKLPAPLDRLAFPSSDRPVHHQHPQLVIAQCKAGVVGSMPALNARPAECWTIG